MRHHPWARHKRRRARRAFSLIELLVAIGVIVMATIMLAAGVLAGNTMVRRGHHTELAYQAAHKELESLRSLGVDNLVPILSGESSVTYSITVPSDLLQGTGTVTLTHVTAALTPTTADTGLIQAQVTVAWSGHASDHGTTTSTTLLRREIAPEPPPDP